MLKEKKMFDEAYEFLEAHYNDKDMDLVAKELPEVCSRYTTPLWGELICDVVSHLERKMKWTKQQEESKAGF